MKINEDYEVTDEVACEYSCIYIMTALRTARLTSPHTLLQSQAAKSR